MSPDHLHEDDRKLLAHVDTQIQLLQQKTSAQKVWDVLFKAMVPVVLAAGSAVITHEIRLSRLEHRIEELPPKWLRDRMEILATTIAENGKVMREEFRELKARVRAVEAQVK